MFKASPDLSYLHSEAGPHFLLRVEVSPLTTQNFLILVTY